MTKKRGGKRGNDEGSVYEQVERRTRKDGAVVERVRWVAAVTTEDGKVKRFYARTRQEADKRLTDAKHDLHRGLPLPNQQLRLDKYLQDWLTDTIKPGRRQGTYLRYRTAVERHINPVIGKTALAKVGPQQVQKLQTALLAKGLGVKSINLVRATLSGALAQAVKWNLVVRNPVPLVDPPHEEHEEPHPLTPEQAQKLLLVAKGHEFEHLYTVMLATGLRIGEALGLSWSAVDLERKRLHVRQQLTIIPGQQWSLTPPKSKSGRRTVPLIPAAIAALEAQRARVLEYRRTCPLPWPIHDLVFCDEVGGPLVGRRVERPFKAHLKAAGLPTTLTPHSLRHSTATYLMAIGVPHKAIMDIMGHSSLAMTTRYEHVMDSVLEDAAQKLASIFPAAGL